MNCSELADALPGFQLHMHYFYQEGPVEPGLSRNGTARTFPSARSTSAARTPLNHLIQRHARAAGVPLSRIHTEEFELL
jgi:hypothetical protein